MPKFIDAFPAFVMCVASVVMSSNGYGQLSGTVTAGLQRDNFQSELDRLEYVHQGFVQYVQSDRLHYVSDYEVKKNTRSNQESSESGLDVNQLYMSFSNPIHNITSKAGRFYRLDHLGFYEMDGVDVRSGKNRLAWQVYGGQPKRDDDNLSTSADSLVGFNITVTQPLNQPIRQSNKQNKEQRKRDTSLRGKYRVDYGNWFEPQSLMAFQFGIQELKNENTHHYANTGFSIKDTVNSFVSLVERHELDLNATYYLADEFSKSKAETAVLNWRLFMDRENYLQFHHERYQPVEDSETFRSQFIKRYALDEQQYSEVAVYHVRQRQSVMAAVRRATKSINGEYESDYGYRASWATTSRHYIDFKFAYDRLALANDSVSSWWFRSAYSINSRSRVQCELGLQQEEKVLTGNNTMKGIRLNGRYLIDGALSLSGSAEYLDHSQRENEYRFKSTLALSFNGV